MTTGRPAGWDEHYSDTQLGEPWHGDTLTRQGSGSFSYTPATAVTEYYGWGDVKTNVDYIGGKNPSQKPVPDTHTETVYFAQRQTTAYTLAFSAAPGTVVVQTSQAKFPAQVGIAENLDTNGYCISITPYGGAFFYGTLDIIYTKADYES